MVLSQDEVLLSDPTVVRELKDWLNLYSRLELPSRVLCFTILLRREPMVTRVAAVNPDPESDIVSVSSEIIRTESVQALGLDSSSLLISRAQRGISLTVLLRVSEYPMSLTLRVEPIGATSRWDGGCISSLSSISI